MKSQRITKVSAIIVELFCISPSCSPDQSSGLIGPLCHPPSRASSMAFYNNREKLLDVPYPCPHSTHIYDCSSNVQYMSTHTRKNT